MSLQNIPEIENFERSIRHLIPLLWKQQVSWINVIGKNCFKFDGPTFYVCPNGWQPKKTITTEGQTYGLVPDSSNKPTFLIWPAVDYSDNTLSLSIWLEELAKRCNGQDIKLAHKRYNLGLYDDIQVEAICSVLREKEDTTRRHYRLYAAVLQLKKVQVILYTSKNLMDFAANLKHFEDFLDGNKVFKESQKTGGESSQSVKLFERLKTIHGISMIPTSPSKKQLAATIQSMTGGASASFKHLPIPPIFPKSPESAISPATSQASLAQKSNPADVLALYMNFISQISKNIEEIMKNIVSKQGGPSWSFLKMVRAGNFAITPQPNWMTLKFDRSMKGQPSNTFCLAPRGHFSTTFMMGFTCKNMTEKLPLDILTKECHEKIHAQMKVLKQMQIPLPTSTFFSRRAKDSYGQTFFLDDGRIKHYHSLILIVEQEHLHVFLFVSNGLQNFGIFQRDFFRMIETADLWQGQFSVTEKEADNFVEQLKNTSIGSSGICSALGNQQAKASDNGAFQTSKPIVDSPISIVSENVSIQNYKGTSIASSMSPVTRFDLNSKAIDTFVRPPKLSGTELLRSAPEGYFGSRKHPSYVEGYFFGNGTFFPIRNDQTGFEELPQQFYVFLFTRDGYVTGGLPEPGKLTLFNSNDIKTILKSEKPDNLAILIGTYKRNGDTILIEWKSSKLVGVFQGPTAPTSRIYIEQNDDSMIFPQTVFQTTSDIVFSRAYPFPWKGQILEGKWSMHSDPYKWFLFRKNGTVDFQNDRFLCQFPQYSKNPHVAVIGWKYTLEYHRLSLTSPEGITKDLSVSNPKYRDDFLIDWDGYVKTLFGTELRDDSIEGLFVGAAQNTDGSQWLPLVLLLTHEGRFVYAHAPKRGYLSQFSHVCIEDEISKIKKTPQNTSPFLFGEYAIDRRSNLLTIRWISKALEGYQNAKPISNVSVASVMNQDDALVFRVNDFGTKSPFCVNRARGFQYAGVAISMNYVDHANNQHYIRFQADGTLVTNHPKVLETLNFPLNDQSQTFNYQLWHFTLEISSGDQSAQLTVYLPEIDDSILAIDRDLFILN